MVFMQAIGSVLSSPIATAPEIKKVTKIPNPCDIPIIPVAVARYSSGNHKFAIIPIPLRDIGVAITNNAVPTYKGTILSLSRNVSTLNQEPMS